MRQMEFERDPADGRTNESSHLWSVQLGTRPNADPNLHWLRCLHEVDKGIFGLTLSPRRAVIMTNFQRSFRELMEIFRVNETSTAHVLMVHVPQFSAYMDLPLGFASDQTVEAQHAYYDAMYQRYRTSRENSSYPQRLLQSVRHYNAMRV